MAGIGPDEIDVAQVQDTESGAEVMHLAETGLCQDGEQEDMIQLGETEISGRLPSTPMTAAAWPTASPSGRPAPAGLRERAATAWTRRARQVPNGPRTAFTHVYGAPGISACTVLST